jgi:hypothetical protein
MIVAGNMSYSFLYRGDGLHVSAVVLTRLVKIARALLEDMNRDREKPLSESEFTDTPP